MPQATPKLLGLALISVISVAVLIVVVTQAARPDAAPGLPAGTWTATGPAEAVSGPAATQAGDARLGELVSFVVEPSPQEGPMVKLTLNYRDGKNISQAASNEMQAGFLQTTLMSPTGVHVPVTFRKKGDAQSVEVSDGQMLVRFAQ